MKLLYLSYWGLNEGLTQSSVLPHLRVLSKIKQVESIVFVSIERESTTSLTVTSIDKVDYQPLFSKNWPIHTLNKIHDITHFTGELIKLVQAYKIDKLLCRTSLGGAIGYRVHRKTGKPFIVESFEPHADYMVDGRVWSPSGLKYRFQKKWERKIIQHAEAIVTVSRHFTIYLADAFDRKALTFGCAVDLDRFAYSEADRIKVREQLGWRTETIGIYVGKFGTIYYNDKAFDIFKKAFDYFEDFRLVILSPNDPTEIAEQLQGQGIPADRVRVDLVPHKEVPAYLSVADFAFSMVRPSLVRKYCSPIKDGEYWANGLPVLSADGIGEDSDIIREENVGAIFEDDLSNLEECFEILETQMGIVDRTIRIPDVARKYRSFEGLKGLYDEMFV